jgi:hypothetical protein
VTKPTVYIVNDGGHDYSDAKRFGTLRFLTRGKLSKYAVSKMYREAEEDIQRSQPTDYILLCSLSTLCAVIAAMFVKKHGCLNLLLLKDGHYIERRLDLERL